ncbi:MAG: hypothetical protein AAFX99_09560, partial [Myxococcota bacterium]
MSDAPAASWPFFFTWSAQRDARPMHITGGHGSWFKTADQGRWLDMASLCYHVNLGHGHPRMVEAICRQAQDLCVATPSACATSLRSAYAGPGLTAHGRPWRMTLN